MTPEEQRIAIAEFCGWKIEPHSQGRRLIHPDGHIVNNNYAEPWRLPDYLNDLNAIHEAENRLTKDMEGVYLDWLSQIVSKSSQRNLHAVKITTSTAAQRSEALLRTIGKWKD